MMRVTYITLLALMLFVPLAARAEFLTLDCSGGVTGTFTFDLSGGTGVTYDENKTIDLSEVEISRSTIAFAQNDISPASETSASSGTSSRFRIDRQANTVERITYSYVDNKVTGETHETGQCKPVPTPHKPL
jgi:hypothetical protein